MMSNIVLPTPTMKGHVKIQVRDAKTLELKREQEDTNIFTDIGYYYIHRGAHFNQRYSSIDGYDTGAPHNELYNSTTLMAEVRTCYYAGRNERDHQDATVQSATFFDGALPYLEVIGRFNPPATTRTIRCIYWGRDNDNTQAIAYSALSTPCTQENTEVLDITYRIECYVDDTPNPLSTGVSLRYNKNVLRVWAENNTWPFPRYHVPIWTGKMPTQPYNLLGPTSESTGYSSRTDYYTHRKYLFEQNMSETSSVGIIFGGWGYYYAGSSAWSNGTAYRSEINLWNPYFPPNSPYKPIQPIHNHSAGAIEPYLDVDFLAASSGSLTVDGSAWTDPDWPKFYRIEYTSSGLVGASNYYWRRRDHVGIRTDYISHTAVSPFRHQQSHYDDMISIPGGHGMKTRRDQAEYDTRSKITWDNVEPGLTWLDHIDGTYVNLDPGTTPALNVGSIKQIDVTDTGDVWVASTSGGLFKIENIKTTPVITHMNNATHGIPVGGDSNCYGVAIGYNDAIIAAFDGAISISTNGGTSWTNYNESSVPDFTFTGISDSNWANIVCIKVDREHPDFQMAIMPYYNVLSPNAICVWWDPVTATAVAGPNWRVYDNYHNQLKCSRYGGFWAAYRYTSSNRGSMRRLQYGTDTYLGDFRINYDNWDEHHAVSFFYDNYGSPYLVSNGDNNSSTNCSALYSIEQQFYAQIHHMGDYRYFEINYASEKDYGNGIFSRHYNPDTNRPKDEFVSLSPDGGPGGTGFDIDAMNGEHSPFEEIVWDEFRWNGAAWEKDYHAPAIDSSGNSNNGVRKNFDIESHEFTGRSLIDASAVFNPSSFTTDGTFAFNLSTLAKEATLPGASVTQSYSRQEVGQVIFELNDGSANRLRFAWDNTNNELLIRDTVTNATVLGTTPLAGGTYRAVVLVNSTTATLYIDNVLIGTHTLNAPLNMANVSGDLLFYIGSRSYNNEYNGRIYPYLFYRGNMENVQIWSREWSGAEVTEDYGLGGTGLIANTTNLEARYLLTESLAETKPTHLSADPLEDGLTIAFNEGTSGNSFVATDYHTFGVVDGLLKDNATNITSKFSIYSSPVDFQFSEFLDAGLANTVPGSSANITERIHWAYSTTAHDVGSTTNAPGQVMVHNNSTDNGINTIQGTSGDFVMTFKPWIENSGRIYLGLDTAPDVNRRYSYLTHSLRFNGDGFVDIYEGGTEVGSDVATFTITDEFKIQRVGTTVTFWKGASLIYTSSTPSSATVYGRATCQDWGYGMYDMTIQYDRPAYIMDIGNSATLTGKFHPHFQRIETESPETIEIFLAGSPADVVVSDTWLGAMTVPAAGQVVINGEYGILLFNAADVGKTVTGSVTVIYNQF